MHCANISQVITENWLIAAEGRNDLEREGEGEEEEDGVEEEPPSVLTMDAL